MNIDCTCYFYKQDFSGKPFFWKQWPVDPVDGRWMFVLSWFGFELVVSGQKEKK